MSPDPEPGPSVLDPLGLRLAHLLRGRVLLLGSIPTPLIRGILAGAESVVALAPDLATVERVRRTVSELGGETGDALAGEPDALRHPSATEQPPFDAALLYDPNSGRAAAEAQLAQVAGLVTGPLVAIARGEGELPLGLFQMNGARPSPAPVRPPAVLSAIPGVAVIVPTQNRAALLERALESVLALDRRPAEVLVVDDGSNDDTPALLERHAGAGGQVRALRRPERGGQARAMNDGIAATSAEWIAWLDDDDYFLPPKLRLGLKAAARDPHVGLAVTAHYIADGAGNPRELRLLPEFAPGELLRLLLRGSIFLGPTALVRRRAYEAIGPRPYDETLERAADYRLWWEIARRFRVAILQVPLTVVCRHPGNALDRVRAGRIFTSVRTTLDWVRAEIPLAELAGGDLPGAMADRDRVLVERSSALLRVGSYGAAETDLAALAANGHERAQNLLGLAAFEQGAYPAAIAAFEAALRRHPQSHAAQHGLAAAHLLLGQRAEAERVLAAVLAQAPQDLLARYHLALAREPDPTAPTAALALAREELAARGVPSALYSPAPPVRGIDRYFAELRRRRPPS
jgi:tetratricopeptide (TPR) repeat protein